MWNNYPFPYPPFNNNINLIEEINKLKERISKLEEKINLLENDKKKNYLKKDDNYNMI